MMQQRAARNSEKEITHYVIAACSGRRDRYSSDSCNIIIIVIVIRNVGVSRHLRRRLVGSSFLSLLRPTKATRERL